jgi:4,5-DOPA dioxygenase extradiol
MSALFIGHGSPLNAISENAFTKSLIEYGKKLPRPTAVIMISAHWITKGVKVTTSSKSRQIYDFGGFPNSLYEVKYEPPGYPEMLEILQNIYGKHEIEGDESYGLDHGTWTVLKFLFPNQDVPVVQMSLNYEKKSFLEHFQFAQKLQPLEDQNILVITSGNIIHNFSEMDMEENSQPQDWAVTFDQAIKETIESNDVQTLLHPFTIKNAVRAIPTADHYLPLIYALGASPQPWKPEWIFEEIQHGSVAMRSVIFNH